MRSHRIVHVDDDPLMLDVVAASLALDPAIDLTSCGNGEEALAAAADQAPDLILCDVMMPGMDGPALLARLRDNPGTRNIPVVFMTGRVQSCELARLRSLGAVAVIAKPFDPAKLAATVRGHLYSIKLAAAGYDFSERLRADAAMLATFRKTLSEAPDKSTVPEGLQSCVHKLAGAAGVFNFPAVSGSATALEQAIIETDAGRGMPGRVTANLDALLECIGRA